MKPMLAATMKTPVGLQYPLLGSPKLDGIRALVLDGRLMSRNLKPIRNVHTFHKFSTPQLNGFDGELICGEHDADVFRRTTSAVSAALGQPDVQFHVFDVYGLSAGFHDRVTYLKSLPLPVGVRVVEQVWLANPRDLRMYEERCLADGYEGIMLRHPNGPYKEGRSTLNEGYLMKVKQFEDAEAEIIGYEERMHNGNAATVNALGHTERSSHQENMVGRGDLGALTVKGINGPYAGSTFSIGSGFDDHYRQVLWGVKNTLKGRVVKYKYFPMGSKDAPRFPVFLGFREE